ncbi:hypothetical protein ACQP1O_17615 [Nocardia sp. CA-151230]|uniref:hypothetical protein n=1 Tax=Nocardia sp. CA-151230 TaxID=3239982 RepID=UPI003D8F1E49
MSNRVEEVAVSDGSGVIDVRGVGHRLDLPGGWSSHCLLRIGGDVTDLDTSAYEGSIGRLIARVPSRPPRPEALAALQQLTIGAMTSLPLHVSLWPLLQLLTPGRYELRGPEPLWPDYPNAVNKHRTTVLREAVIHAEPDEPVWIYPDPDHSTYLVPTEGWPPSDDRAVARYRQLINAGRRPAVIALRTISRFPMSGFVIDGHHKLRAYLDNETIPAVVWITRLDAPEMTAAEVRESFPELAKSNQYFRHLLRVLDENESTTTDYSQQ